MKIKLALIFIFAVLVLALFTYEQIVPPFSSGDFMPQFSLLDTKGNKINLSDFRGQPVLIHFWATWCPQCVEEIPLLNNFAASSSKIKVLAVSEDEAKEAVAEFFRGLEPSFPVLMDSEGLVADTYKSYKVPETFLLDENGKFLHRFIGAVSWDNPKVLKKVEELLYLGR
ncbi:MAG: TlpA family protein disulfide reductase [Deltaproteobacteria bacterium]|nr:TlpA family protein disulfide reductase [Deltaproteobacteria bacterium]MBI2342419.1 TlpA family protein disulfide reductase [Deltaproteobacteria bacterium]